MPFCVTSAAPVDEQIAVTLMVMAVDEVESASPGVESAKSAGSAVALLPYVRVWASWAAVLVRITSLWNFHEWPVRASAPVSARAVPPK